MLTSDAVGSGNIHASSSASLANLLDNCRSTNAVQNKQTDANGGGLSQKASLRFRTLKLLGNLPTFFIRKHQQRC